MYYLASGLADPTQMVGGAAAGRDCALPSGGVGHRLRFWGAGSAARAWFSIVTIRK